MKLLFGPQLDSTLTKDHEEARLGVLLDPPPGSPMHVMHSNMDDPSLARSPRPATEAEQKRVQEVREMQAAIRRRVGAGRSPSSGDMRAILVSFGDAWVARLPTYNLAVNTMDQGVPVGGYRG
jgi:hypothetical protein